MRLLYIQPEQVGTTEPVIDLLTCRMTAAFRQAKRADAGFWGMHACICGALSQSFDYRLPNGVITNSLCIHYLAFHRDEVPEPELQAVELLAFGEAVPTEGELTEYSTFTEQFIEIREQRKQATRRVLNELHRGDSGDSYPR